MSLQSRYSSTTSTTAMRTSACPCSLSGRFPSRCLIRANRAVTARSLQAPPRVADAGEALGQLLDPLAVAHQGVHAGGTEQLAAVVGDVAEGRVQAPCALVGALRDQRVEPDRHRHDPGLHRDRVAAQALRVAAAVEALLMVEGDGGAELGEAVLAGAEQVVADLRV